MEFLVIDFETANSDPSSICQIGLVKFINGEIFTLIDTLINPNAVFSRRNIDVHGINENDVLDAPSFKEIYPELENYIKDSIVFNHNGADKSKFESARNKSELPIFDVVWLNSATLVKRTWTQFAESGFGLEKMCSYLNINYTPHNAASDALATAEVIRLACEIKGFTIEDWKLELLQTRSYRNYDDSQKIKGDITKAPDLSAIENKSNPFFGKKVVVSGTYQKWPDRLVLAGILKELGADIDGGIGKYTNFLCAGKGVGPKKIEKMLFKIANGEDARILKESDIIELLEID